MDSEARMMEQFPQDISSSGFSADGGYWLSTSVAEKGVGLCVLLEDVSGITPESDGIDFRHSLVVAVVDFQVAIGKQCHQNMSYQQRWGRGG